MNEECVFKTWAMNLTPKIWAVRWKLLLPSAFGTSESIVSELT